MSAQYKRFLKLLEKWPIDKSKSGRDFGEHLREQLKVIIKTTNITSISDEVANKNFDALNRLSNNVYAEKYKREHTATATGLTSDQCNQILSSDFLEYLEEEDRAGIFGKKSK